MSPSKGGKKSSDRNLLFMVAGGVVALLVVATVIAGSSPKDSDEPSTYNAGPDGIKAAYVALDELGKPVGRWQEDLDKLDSVDAEHTTLVLAEPQFIVMGREQEQRYLQDFLERGGRVLLTGEIWASMLPGGSSGPPNILQRGSAFCDAQPEGPGLLARSGDVQITDAGAWTAKGPQFRVEERCGDDAVVVRFPVGKGEAVWWSSAWPMTNTGLKRDANLKLLMGSLYGESGGDRRVLFDEFVRTPVNVGGDSARTWVPRLGIWLQGIAAMVFLVLSFSRRKGPLRLPVEVPRTSPMEFAVSMGDLYAKAGVSAAATDAACRRLLRTAHLEAGVARAAIDDGPDAVAEALRTRLRGDWTAVAEHLKKAQRAHGERLRPGSALALIRALGEDEERIRRAVMPAVDVKVIEGKEIKIFQGELAGSSVKE
ncbi:MAG TPA: DUF4350 domain-containing protein [Acidobacteriaceae bacterium]|jgi:hypothetical protein